MASKSTDFAASWNVFFGDGPGPLLWLAPSWTKFMNMLTESGTGMRSRKAALPAKRRVQVANVAAFLKLTDAPEASTLDTKGHELSINMMDSAELMLTALDNCTMTGVLAAVDSKVPSAFFADSCLSKLEAFEKEFAAPAKDPASSFGGGLGDTEFNFFHKIKMCCRSSW
jgi:hypothetical protein